LQSKILNLSAKVGLLQALAEGAIEEALTFATTFLGGKGTIGLSSKDRDIDSFVDSGLSELVFAFFRGGRSSSSPELIEEH
jgi:hypothetical protein